MASGTSKSSELKLTGVARASLEELKLDYQDFLRNRRLPQWPESDFRRQELIDRRPKTVDDFAAWVRAVRESGRSGHGGHGGQGGHGKPPAASTASTKSTKSTEISANGALVLLSVVCPLLDRQLAAQGAAFEREGGFRERLYRVRNARRTGR